MKTFFAENLGLKVFSLLLGVSLWYAVAQEQGAEFAFSIPIELRDVPEGLEVVQESANQVDVRLRGPSEALRALSPQNLSVAVDLSDAEPGAQAIYLTPDDVAVPFGARVMRVTPAIIDIELDRTIERTVNVIPRVSGAPAEGFELYGIELVPTTVTVVGPASQVRDLEQVTTVPVSAEGLRQPFSRSVRLELDPLVRLESAPRVDLTLDVREVRIRRELSGVPIVVVPTLASTELEPQELTVLVEGPKSLVEQMGDGILAAEARVDGLTSGTHQITPVVHVTPPGAFSALHIVSVSPGEVTVRIQ